jgi:hypothetical protein
MDDGRRDFDFLHGNWMVRNRRLTRWLEGSDDWIEFDSRATVRPILHGLANADTISAEDVPGVGAFEGTTLRLFDPERRIWTIHWASTRAPGRLDPPLTGSFTDGVGIFDGVDTHDGRPVRIRFEWTSDGPDHARWQQALSEDGGETWEVNWVMEFSRVAS